MRERSSTGREERSSSTGCMLLLGVCLHVGPPQMGSLYGRASGETHTHSANDITAH